MFAEVKLQPIQIAFGVLCLSVTHQMDTYLSPRTLLLPWKQARLGLSMPRSMSVQAWKVRGTVKGALLPWKVSEYTEEVYLLADS